MLSKSLWLRPALDHPSNNPIKLVKIDRFMNELSYAEFLGSLDLGGLSSLR